MAPDEEFYEGQLCTWAHIHFQENVLRMYDTGSYFQLIKFKRCQRIVKTDVQAYSLIKDYIHDCV